MKIYKAIFWKSCQNTIVNNPQNDIEMKQSKLTHGSLFSGIEGFGLGAAFAGIKTLWSCEYEDYQASIIKKNFGENHEINRDIRTYSNPTFVDIISGGFLANE